MNKENSSLPIYPARFCTTGHVGTDFGCWSPSLTSTASTNLPKNAWMPYETSEGRTR